MSSRDQVSMVWPLMPTPKLGMRPFTIARYWSALSSGTLAILNDAIKLDYGTVIVVGNAGAVLVSRDGGESFTLLQQADRKGLQRILRAGTDFLVFGETGVRRLEIPQPAR
jgi:photosystem II stability/assembly factor-like uncharacterized protein